MIIAAVCFDGVDDEVLIEAARIFLPSFERVEAWCGYGDSAERFMEEVADRHHGPPPQHAPRHISIDAEQADAIARHGVALLQRAGFEATPRTRRTRSRPCPGRRQWLGFHTHALRRPSRGRRTQVDRACRSIRARPCLRSGLVAACSVILSPQAQGGDRYAD
jgi:hypothetical protein